jgi:hypothetical protein
MFPPPHTFACLHTFNRPSSQSSPAISYPYSPPFPFSSRLLQLFLPEELEKPNTNKPLQQQSHPKASLLQPFTPQHQIRKHRPRPILIRRRRPRHNRRHTPQHLRTHERKHNMEPRQRLQQYHPEPNPLNRIQHAKPQPERATEERAR